MRGFVVSLGSHPYSWVQRYIFSILLFLCKVYSGLPHFKTIAINPEMVMSSILPLFFVPIHIFREWVAFFKRFTAVTPIRKACPPLLLSILEDFRGESRVILDICQAALTHANVIHFKPFALDIEAPACVLP